MRIRPDAIAAAHMPSTNGVTSDAMPNTRVHARCHPVSGSPYERNANAAPRITIPAIAMPNGTYSATLSAANAGGNAANSTVTTKINQTWFASQTGPIAFDIRERSRSRAGPRASRSQTPPPKSAPPSSTYNVIPAPIASSMATCSAVSLTCAPRARLPRAVSA